MIVHAVADPRVVYRDSLSTLQCKYDKLEQLSKDMNNACRKIQKENESIKYEFDECKHQTQSELNGCKNKWMVCYNTKMRYKRRT